MHENAIYESGIQIRVCNWNEFSFVMGTQKNHLNETALLSPQNMFKLMGKKKNDNFMLKNFA